MSEPVCPGDQLDDWFVREILVHERALLKFLLRVWPDKAEVDDLCQETYVRVYESAARERPTQPRAFLFAAARHLMIDKIRRGRIVSIEVMGNIDSLNVLVDELSPEHRASAGQDLRRLAQAFASLPANCRDIMWMMKVEDVTQSDIARRMGVPRKTVEKRALRGFRMLQEAYFGGTEAEVKPSQPEWVRVQGGSDHE